MFNGISTSQRKLQLMAVTFKLLRAFEKSLIALNLIKGSLHIDRA
jgi:hypothetical protein